MQILVFFFGTFALAAAQYPYRNLHPGYRNVNTPLATSASKEKPFLSIPIVLMPDGKLVPKPSQISYQYMSQNGNGQQPNNQRSPKSQAAANFQTAVAPSQSYNPQTKQSKNAQISMTANGARRPTGLNLQKNNNQAQQQQQNVKFIQQQNPQNVAIMQAPNQRHPPNQQQMVSNQPTNELYKQNVLNFINFANHLGAQVASQQRETQKNQMATPTATYGPPEAPNNYERYTFQGPTTQAQADVSSIMYLQSQPQTNQGPHNLQFQQQAPQPPTYNIPQVQNQVMSVPVSLPYSQPNGRQLTQGVPQNNNNMQNLQQQMSFHNQISALQQNLGANGQFPGIYNNPVQANTYIQAPQQTLPPNFYMIPSQESLQNTRPVFNANYDQQSQQMVRTHQNPQPQIQVPTYDLSGQIKQQNYANQNQAGHQTYITPEGHQISFVPQNSPVAYTTQQSPQQQIANQNSPPSLQNNFGQPGEQKVYISYQNHQDLSASNAPPASPTPMNSAPSTQAVQQVEQIKYVSVPAHAANLQNAHANHNEQVAYRVQQQASTVSQTSEPTPYTYVSEQPTYSTTSQKHDYSSDGGKLIYATSSAKEIHYSPSGQGYTTSQMKNSEEQPSQTYAQYPETSSDYKYETDEDDDVEYTPKQQTRGQSRDKQEKAETDGESGEGDEETSYKVVYIPMDILKNILNNNSVEKRSDSQEAEKSS